ncbi:F-box domain-containing protein [Mycena sanguinolenta]|uniref:F-box domain-containing protein n=1 Tax=Mycena sanguinolenta TaxID=230812 RepID=A0A8H7CVG3_9AGAR|nr:F-box domain-containing protein [Mycena sanguinolenta]
MPPSATHVLRQRLSDLNDNISHHEIILQELKQQRSAILSELNIVAYPVLTLPPEITAEIFKWCIDTGLRLSPSVAPLLLTRICRDWRALAFSTPALWDTISEIDFGAHPRAHAVVKTWFSHAGTRPLSLGIICPESLDSARLESVIFRHASRLQSLDVMANSEVLCDLGAVQSFPILRNLTLACLDDSDDDEGHIQLFDIQGVPVLRHLSLEGVRPSMIIMPWGQLTKMTLSLLSLWECLMAMRWATSLLEFRRQGPPEQGEESTPEEESPVHHSSLISLSISTSDEDDNILPLLTLPRLQRLELGGRFEVYQTDMDVAIVPFLSRVSSTLRTFTVGMSPTVPIQWFHPLTQLTTLELVHSMGLPFKSDVIRALDRRASPDFLPKLQSFVFADCGSNQVDDELLDALASRCDVTDAAHAKLESFSLFWPTFDYEPGAPFCASSTSECPSPSHAGGTRDAHPHWDARAEQFLLTQASADPSEQNLKRTNNDQLSKPTHALAIISSNFDTACDPACIRSARYLD